VTLSRLVKALTFLCALLCGNAGAGVVGHWRFDGKTVKDQSAKGNDGVIEGSLPEFDGLGSHVLIKEKTPFGFTNTLTAALWVRASALKNNTVLFGVPHTNESWTTPMFGMYGSDGRVVFGLWGDRGASKMLLDSTSELPLDTWTFLAGTYDGAMAKLYVNGVLSAEKPRHGNILRNGQPLRVGMGLGAKPSLKGSVGELRLYDNALNAGEVRALFEQTKPAYNLSAPAKRDFKDGTVIVETHRNSPESSGPWRPQTTRLLELLNGYKPSGDNVKLDSYGGWLDRPKEKATGFFYVRKIEGRDWLIDPDGCRYFNIGINAVREPKNAAANWAETVTALLRANGFNGLGNFGSSQMQKVKSPLVWVRRQNFMFEFAKKKKLTEPASGTVGFLNRCMPVFYPDFEAFCDELAKVLTETVDDPTLLGIMTDNELQCPTDLLDRYLSLGTDDPGYKAAAAWLAGRKITQRERYQFIAFAFERYYRIVTKAIRKYDRNHLYLGSRINYHTGQFDNPWFWKVLAPYHDVVSVNYYGIWGPDKRLFAERAAWSGKPVLLTEWYAKAMDVPGLANTKGAGWLVRTQEDRARYYQHFALNALEIKNVVGWHFFKFMDDPKESVALDSAGGANKGLCDIRGKPYAPLLERACAVNREAYPLIEFFDARNR